MNLSSLKVTFAAALVRWFPRGGTAITPRVQKIIDVLREIDAEGSKEDRHALEHAYAAFHETSSARILDERGYKIDCWHPRRVRRRILDHEMLGEGGEITTFANFDHPYKLKKPGKTEYTFEPYQLTNDHIQSLARLVEAGYNVVISNNLALHYPGHTLVVSIEAPK